MPPVCARWHHSCSLRPRPDHGRAERAHRYPNRRSKRAALTLTPLDLEHRPDLATRELRSLKGASAVIRPLTSKDVTALGSFLEGLSSRTRHFSTFEGHDVKAAQDLCDAIGKYDKLRFVLEAAPDKIVGLLEMSLDIPKGDAERYARAKISLSSETDCRFGPTLADQYQNKGLGTSSMAFIVDVARELGKERIVLWGGVREDNESAIRFYEKVGFTHVCECKREDGVTSLDMMLEIARSRGP